MRTLTHASLTLLLVALLAAIPAAATPGADDAASTDLLPGQVTTGFYLFTGSPEPSPEGTAGVLLAPGTVIPVDTPAAGANDVAASLAESRNVFSLAEKLATTLRLADVRPQYEVKETMVLDRVVQLPAVTATSTVHPRVTLLGETDELATYRVTFQDGTEVLSETNVSVAIGGRAVVGGLDGADAPYVFLLVRPIPPGAGAGVSSDVKPPLRLAGAPPAYPEDARKEKIEGVVILQAVVEKDGTISQARVLKGIYPSLDRASVEAVKSWTFEPATLNGKPVAVFYNLTIRFRLSKDDPADNG